MARSSAYPIGSRGRFQVVLSVLTGIVLATSGSAQDEEPLEVIEEDLPRTIGTTDTPTIVEEPEVIGEPAKPEAPAEAPEGGPPGMDIDDPNSFDVEPSRTKEKEVRLLEDVPKTPPVTYIIKPGDTMWDICIQFLGDPFYWPKLWQLNQYIRNPHLIFPGNLVKFYPGDGDAPPMLEIFAKEADAEIMEARFSQEAEVQPEPLFSRKRYEGLPIRPEDGDDYLTYELKIKSYFSAEEPLQIGEVVHAAKEGVILSTNDQIYIQFYDPSVISTGDIFTVYSIRRPIEDPDAFLFNDLGFLVALYGTIQIVNTRGGLITARITEGFEELQRGYPVMAFFNPYRKVRARQADYYNETTCIAVETEHTLIGEREIIYLKGGEDRRMKVGDSYDILHAADGYLKARIEDMPMLVKGHVVIIEVWEHVSMGVIAHTRRAVELGDRLVTAGLFTPLNKPIRREE